MALDSPQGLGWGQNVDSFPVPKVEQMRVARNNYISVGCLGTFQDSVIVRVGGDSPDAPPWRYDLADIVKLGDGEKKFLEENGVNLGDLDLKLTAITMGEKGSTLIHGGGEIATPPYPVKAVDSTGAGDAYMAALLAALYSMGKLGDLSLNDEELKLVGRFANVVAALSTTRRGAWSVPTLSQLEEIEEIKPIVDGLRRRGR